MKGWLGLVCALASAGCATAPPPAGTLVDGARFARAVAPGVTTREQLLATLGKTKAVVFDSGYEAWLYQAPADGERLVEYVVLLGPDGVVKKARRR